MSGLFSRLAAWRGRVAHTATAPEEPVGPAASSESLPPPCAATAADDCDGAGAVLFERFGLRRSRSERRPVAADGTPLPWYTYPAIEFLDGLDWRDKRVFEYGAGHSSYFWAARAAEVVTVEQEPDWYAEIAGTTPGNLMLINETSAERFPHVIGEHGLFDVIVDDASQRLECARACLASLRPGGLIILDNSDWFVAAARFLREQGFLQVDMHGFGPINNYTWCTSLFFSRDFTWTPRHAHQPMHGIGALRQYAAEEDGLR